MSELRRGWHIQSRLVQRVSEDQDYSKARGATRLAESLLDKLLAMLLSSLGANVKIGFAMAETVGHLVRILVEFVARRELLNESALREAK